MAASSSIAASDGKKDTEEEEGEADDKKDKKEKKEPKPASDTAASTGEDLNIST